MNISAQSWSDNRGSTVLSLDRVEDPEDDQEFEMDDVNSDWCEDKHERDEKTENGAENMELDENVDDEHNDEETNDDDDENNNKESGDEDGDNNGDDESESNEDEDDEDNFTVHKCTNPCELLVPLSTLLLDIFHLFFTSTLLLLICDQTNTYAEQLLSPSQFNKFQKVTVEELLAYFGFMILMGINKLPTLHHYWKKDLPFVIPI